MWDTDGIDDFYHNASKLAATISLILVKVGSLTLLAHFKACLELR
jgi:hypothetical protein